MFKNILSCFMSFLIFAYTGIVSYFPKDEAMRIVVPENWEMSVGDSRTVECVFGDGVTNRVITWSVSDENTATVDEWGRVTALNKGTVTVKAEAGNLSDSAELNIVTTPTKSNMQKSKIDYSKEALDQVDNLQKIVTKYSKSSNEIPSCIKECTDYTQHQTVVTADGAKWEITSYGVLRTDENAEYERDREQRFMGDRYFYSADTTDGKVLAIFSDGEYGIWTVMQNGVTHIAMVEMSGDEKASQMSKATEECVTRLGYSSSSWTNGYNWYPSETDNDGLWTSMYGAGELMRYAMLRDDKSATEEEISAARKTAYTAAEAILMLHFISMRSGTTESYVRHQLNGKIPGDTEDRYLSAEALTEGGDYSQNFSSDSPAKSFKTAFALSLFSGNNNRLMNVGSNEVLSADSWVDTKSAESQNTTYAKRTRLLEGFVARTYSLKTGSYSTGGHIYWSVNDDGTATGVSSLPQNHTSYYLNNENLRGVTIDASKDVPERLWNNLLGEDVSKSDIIYKGDTSADEIIGHMFIFKLMYDILGDEDAELKELMVTAINNLAQHLVDNGYMLVDGTGQPTTWANFSREMFLSSSALGSAPLHALVVLNVFKTAAYVTGYQKWEDEYRMAALDPAYEYAELSSQHSERMLANIMYVAGESVSPLLQLPLKLLSGTKLYNTILQIVSNDSDLEMAMLGYYTLFQIEDDEEILNYLRKGLDGWWETASHTENPLWYVIYQLAYPNKKIKDAYDNNILETATWSMSRHPVDTRRTLASNSNRDDLANIDLSALGVSMIGLPTYSLTSKYQPYDIGESTEILDYVKFILSISKLEWTVAAPDERAMYKYNINTYNLETYANSNCMEPSTTYTLPYWMARYHGIINK